MSWLLPLEDIALQVRGEESEEQKATLVRRDRCRAERDLAAFAAKYGMGPAQGRDQGGIRPRRTVCRRFDLPPPAAQGQGERQVDCAGGSFMMGERLALTQLTNKVRGSHANQIDRQPGGHQANGTKLGQWVMLLRVLSKGWLTASSAASRNG